MTWTPDHWNFDALQAQLGLMKHLQISRPEWTKEDSESLEEYCSALMQATQQMSCGYGRDVPKDYVSFGEVETILNSIAVLACRMVLSGVHRRVA